MATFSHNLKSWGSAGSAEHPILLRIQHQGKRRYLSSGISIHKKHWNERRSEVRKDHPQHQLLNRRLALQLYEANTAYNELELAYQTMLTTVDLFAGCGGMSLGFARAGCKIVSAYDSWPLAVNIYERNFDHPIYEIDLSEESCVSEVEKYDPELVIGGPPCQDFSSAGHRNESLGRADLTISFANIVSELAPNYFVMENVPRIKKSQVLMDVRDIFKRHGYGLTEIVLDASLCGVPQARKRFFMIGSRQDPDGFLKDALKADLAPKRMTVHDYFGDSLGFEHYFRVPRSYQRRGVFSIYEPAPTVRGVDRPVPSGYPGHPGDTAPISNSIRTLTIQERALFQTFPASFEWEGPKSHVNQVIGNAVPVNLAKYVADKLLGHIKSTGRNAQSS